MTTQLSLTQVTPSQLARALAHNIKFGFPTMIKGAPGVGKSDIVLQACETAGADVLLTHPVVSDPTDYKGLPGILNGEAQFLPYGDLRKLINAKVLTVFFIDDLGDCTEAARNDYSFTKPNRRYLQSGIIMPSLYNLEVGEIVLLADTSIDETTFEDAIVNANN